MKHFFIIAVILICFSLSAECVDFTLVNLDSLYKAAWNAYQQKDYEQAAQFYLEFMQHDVKNGDMCYNLACCYGLLGKDSLAVKYLDYAFQNGFDDIDHASTDPDFDSIREKENFSRLINSNKRKYAVP